MRAGRQLRRRLAGIGATDVAAARDRTAHALERGTGRTLPRARGRIERLIEAAARRARADYRAEPWPGSILLVTSTEYERKPAYLTWPQRARIERRTLPLGHIEMLRDPGAQLLAACLEEEITAAGLCRG